MRYDFDAPIDRAGSDSEKWAKYAGRDILPLWVADMDFAAPPAVIAALQARLTHGVFGYNQPTAGQTRAVVDYLARCFDWAVDPDWIVWLPGLVSGLNVACRAVGAVGDGDDAVCTATPIYPPFLFAPRHAARRLHSVPLVLEQEQRQDAPRWRFDFAALDAAFAQSRLFLFCHPHNPVGRAWDDDELNQIAQLAERHDVIVCADEIHNGLILAPSRRHRVFAMLDAAVARRTITLLAPSKTFNIPGLGAACAVIADAALRQRFRAAMAGIVPHVNLFGMAALEAAFSQCDDWHAALIDYLRGNAQAVGDAVARIPGLSMTPVEATYLAWIDAREFARQRGIANPAQYFESRGLGLSDGAAFAAPGFVRLNFGTRRALLDEALARLARA